MDANFSFLCINQSNVSRKFTTWAAIIAVPTMIAGFYGMNFQNMPELQWQYGYYIVILFTFSICGSLYYFFRKADWL